MTGLDWRRQAAVHFLAGRNEEAASAFEKALACTPQDPAALAGLALVRLRQGRLGEAGAGFEATLRLRPDDPVTLVNLGNLEVRRQNPAAAQTCYRRALDLNPNLVEAWNNLGNLCQADGRLQEAEDSYRRALQIDSKYASACNNLGNLCQNRQHLAEAEVWYRRALDGRPDDPQTMGNLGRLCLDQGRLDEALELFESAVAINPSDLAARSRLIFAMHYHPSWDGAELLALTRRWWPPQDVSTSCRSYPNEADPLRRLRIGYVSPDLREHSVAYFLRPLWAHHDRRQIQLFGYADVARPDRVTFELKDSCDAWRSVAARTDDQVAKMIRDDRIDVLIDLAGHSAGNRLGVFARRPAPIQMTWLGCPGTTGLAAMDYRLTDALADPPAWAAEHWSERLIRLPYGFLCYAPPGQGTAVTDPPVVASGQVTFGSFNFMGKLNDRLITVWGEILEQVAGSRLILKCGPLRDPIVAAALGRRFAARGLDPQRLVLWGRHLSIQEHLAAYAQIDIGLDTFPYNGTTTTCEALWMGVPVITLAGGRHASRVGVSLMTRLGLDQLVATTEADYVRRAVELAYDPERLGGLRATIRPRMQRSAVCDGSAFARAFEGVLRKVWIDWCRDRIVAKSRRDMGAPHDKSGPVISVRQ